MRLILKAVPASRGLGWVRDGIKLYARRPLAFTLLFLCFVLTFLAVSRLPVVGLVLPAAMLPLLSLGFMVASRSALAGKAVRPSQFIEPLRGDAARRRSLLLLCAIYGLASLAGVVLFDVLAGDALQRLEAPLARGSVTPAELDAVIGNPALQAAMLLVFVFGSLLSVPFWHAPALVHWGEQGVGQSLFSSTLALWRCRGAMLLYTLALAGLAFAALPVCALVARVVGSAQLFALLYAFSVITLSTVFYVSLFYVFNDSFAPASD